ncbi:MAG: 3-methyl-2-oxobutanoate hydroxymethyltransferase [Adlercreutzia sp.]
MQGKTADSARKLPKTPTRWKSRRLRRLPILPAELAERVSAELTIPTIGIGAGAGCDGQVLVNQDMLGMFHDFTPKFVRRFAEVGDVMLEAYRAYDAAVKDGTFPAAEHTYAAPAGVLENL